ncbi:aromatic ring-hydroxylating oxygenase subunit alpha [Actinocorallia sp. A-T 12471]|uniref:aromatic ring-hydroxylating oxygenase subunit alpha n=1 Tax=Actinocorallia sp. A-T 12471 TaxID=3089813 RepID=UPI0029D1BC2A|nr:Rieske 2Fe-2S domain-containing protein [Actinocorallia sp. A-T 12471]MDX6740619.1 Rieske 2Fe-2S domain-containing protein [Actinocorallia sp. A-T 12471]
MTQSSHAPCPPQPWIDDKTGTVSRRIFDDEGIFALEKARIFRRSWLYLAHESEIAAPGDVVTRRLAGDPVIVARRDDGGIGVYLNSCRHRGVRLCRVDSGSMRRFVCPYHGWTFGNDGALLSTTVDNLFPEGTDFTKLGLIPVPRVATYKGLIFGSWNTEVGPLEDHLGDFRWYLDLFFARTPGGATVLGPPQRFVVNADWKTAAINFGTDNTHIITTHIGPLTLSKTAFDRKQIMGALRDAVQVSTPGGHSVSLVTVPGRPYAHYPEELHPLYERTLDESQRVILRDLAIGVSTVFPNLSFIENIAQEVAPGVHVKGLLMRQWQPVGPGKIEVLSWCFAEREASAEYREAALVRGVNDFGVGGVFEQEDVELWSSIGDLSRSPAGDGHPFVFATALPHLDDPVADHPGPGRAYRPFASEITQFKFLQHWNQLMTEEPA